MGRLQDDAKALQAHTLDVQDPLLPPAAAKTGTASNMAARFNRVEGLIFIVMS